MSPSTFNLDRISGLLWPDLLVEFGQECEYHLTEGDSAVLQGLLTEGREGEFRATGRYARFHLEVAALPRLPQASDWIDFQGVTYDVESVEATTYGIAHLVIKLSGQAWLTK